MTAGLAALWRPTVIDKFAGPGGWDEGARALGIYPRGLELDTDACDTARAAGHYRHQCNVAAMNPTSVLMPWGQPEGLIGSPPCPGFAKGGLGRGRRDSTVVLEALAEVHDLDDLERLIAALHGTMTDERTLLALEPLRWALALTPGWLTWEQVPPVLPLWDACAAILRRHGYTVATGCLHAEAFGVPQVRKRAVLVARSPGMSAELGPATLPAPTHSRFHAHDPGKLDEGVLPWVSMADALGWGMTHRPYPALAPGTARGGQDPMMLGGSGARQTVQRELAAGRWTTTPERPVGPGDPWTLDTRRALRITVAEAARLQSFPDGYPWHGTKTQQFRQIGDAVPPLMARAIVAEVAGLELEGEVAA